MITWNCSLKKEIRCKTRDNLYLGLCYTRILIFLRLKKDPKLFYLTVVFLSKHEMLMEIIRNYLTMKGQLLKRCVLISARFVSHARGSCGGLFFIIWHLVTRSIVTDSCRLRLRAAIIVLECSDCYKCGYIYIQICFTSKDDKIWMSQRANNLVLFMLHKKKLLEVK